jgi:hypothetical protein
MPKRPCRRQGSKSIKASGLCISCGVMRLSVLLVADKSGIFTMCYATEGKKRRDSLSYLEDIVIWYIIENRSMPVTYQVT